MTLKPGDVLLFNRRSLYNTIIRVKTWSRVSHVEVVLNGGELGGDLTIVAASRNGQGVRDYRADWSGLDTVLRPIEQPFNIAKAYEWFLREARGQKYDWLGLLAFTSAKYQGRENGKMFCSEFATRFLRAGGLDPFNGYDADGIAPGEFLKSPVFFQVWRV